MRRDRERERERDRDPCEGQAKRVGCWFVAVPPGVEDWYVGAAVEDTLKSVELLTMSVVELLEAPMVVV